MSGRLPGTEYGREAILHPYEAYLRYAWSHGVALSRFFEEMKNGRLVGRRCVGCNRVMIPPRMYCEECFRPTDEWVELKDTGTVLTFSICYVGTDASRLAEPQIPAVIEIDGASRNMGILHLLGEVKPEDVKIGMRVRAVWLPPEQRRGAITDIKYFRPL